MDQKQLNELALMNSNVTNTTGRAAASKTPFLQRQAADIFKLDIDCCEELFDFLPLEDLISVGKTCKFFQQVIGYILQLNYKRIDCGVDGEAIFIHNPFTSYTDYTNADHLFGFIKTLTLATSPEIRKNLLCENHISNGLSKLRRLKKIDFINWKLSKAEMETNKVVFSKIETLNFFFFKNMESFHENVLNFFPNLKHLRLTNAFIWDITWLSQKYPKLQSFKMTIAFKKILPFLELNPNIQNFETNTNYIWEYRDSLLTTNVKLDTLLVIEYKIEIGMICNLLNELHKRGFYKKLKFHSYGPGSYDNDHSQQKVDHLATLESLVSLRLNIYFTTISLSALCNSLEEMYIDNALYISDLSFIANNLINLKQIHFGDACLRNIHPFIFRSLNLEKIVFYDKNCIYGTYFDIYALNIERKKLPNAKKITIYVNEQVYLATKWAFKNTDLSLIRLKRIESFQDENSIDFNFHGRERNYLLGY